MIAGVDVVRAELALLLARDLDDPKGPPYTRARTVAELRAVLDGLEHLDVPAAVSLDVDALLREATR